MSYIPNNTIPNMQRKSLSIRLDNCTWQKQILQSIVIKNRLAIAVSCEQVT